MPWACRPGPTSTSASEQVAETKRIRRNEAIRLQNHGRCWIANAGASQVRTRSTNARALVAQIKTKLMHSKRAQNSRTCRDSVSRIRRSTTSPSAGAKAGCGGVCTREPAVASVTYQIQVPAGVQPGQQFPVQINARKHHYGGAARHGPGSTIQLQVQVQAPAQAAQSPWEIYYLRCVDNFLGWFEETVEKLLV